MKLDLSLEKRVKSRERKGSSMQEEQFDLITGEKEYISGTVRKSSIECFWSVVRNKIGWAAKGHMVEKF